MNCVSPWYCQQKSGYGCLNPPPLPPNYFFVFELYSWVRLSQCFQIDSKRRIGNESFEACCRWALLNVQIITLLFPSTVQKYIYSPVSKVHAGSYRVSVIHRTLTWTTGSLTCVRYYESAYTRGGAHRQRVSTTLWLGKTPSLCCGRDSNLCPWYPLDLEADALPIEPPTSPFIHSFHWWMILMSDLRQTWVYHVWGGLK